MHTLVDASISRLNTGWPLLANSWVLNEPARGMRGDASREGGTMYATNIHCFYCGADFPLTHRGSCTVCATPGEESALNETLGVQYDLAAIKRRLDREEMARRPSGLWRYRELLPVV